MTRLKTLTLPALMLLALSPGLTSLTAHAATRHHRHHTSHPATPGPAPVILAAHPGTQLDTDARKLNEDDLQDAVKHHDHPIVLTGSAPLSSNKQDEALFVQLQSARLCGSAGCTTSVYLRHNDSWTTVLDSINGDISLLPTTHKGMHDLLIGRGDKWIWDGSQYQDTLSAPRTP